MKDIDLKDIFGKFKSRPHQGGGKNPFRDWKIIVITFLVINLSIIGGSLYLFWMINSRSIFESVVETPSVEKLNEKALSQIIERYDERAIDLVTVETTVPSIVDPSI